MRSQLLFATVLAASLACSGLPQLPPAPDFDGWSSEDLEARLEADGWAVRRCSEDVSREFSFIDCVGRREGHVVVAGLATYESTRDARWADDEPVEGLVSARDGRAVLQIEVHLPKEAHALADAAHELDAVDRASVEDVLSTAGFAIEECFAERGRDGTYAACLGRDGERWAMLSVSRFRGGPGGRGGWERSMEAGIVYHERGPYEVEADIQHQGHARALLDGMTQPTADTP